MMGRIGRGVVLGIVAVWLAGVSTGCGEMTRGVKEAEFVIPKSKVLVFVDARPGRGVPLDVAPSLAKSITNHLYRYKVGDNFVNPEKISELQENPEAFERLDVMTVARSTGADVVVYVDLWLFQAATTSEGLLTEGSAEALVRVVDSNGKRLWPEGTTASQAQSVVQPATVEQQSESDVKKKMLEDLTVRIGRKFHKYSLDDKYLSR